MRMQTLEILWFRRIADGANELHLYPIRGVPEEVARSIIAAMAAAGYSFIPHGSSSLEYCPEVQNARS